VPSPSRGPGGTRRVGRGALCQCVRPGDFVIRRFTNGFSIEEFRICFMTAPCAPHPTWLPCSCVGSLRSRSLEAPAGRPWSGTPLRERGSGAGSAGASGLALQHISRHSTPVQHTQQLFTSRSSPARLGHSRSQRFTTVHIPLVSVTCRRRLGPAAFKPGHRLPPALTFCNGVGGGGGGAKGDDTGFGRGATSSVGTVAEGARGLAANLIA
jgi:hypothetical protein